MQSLGKIQGVTNLYLARHGQTTWNVEHRIQGMSDSPLTKRGLQQAALLGKHLSSTPLDVIYSSSSKRAMNTAEIINENQEQPRPLYAEDDLREISLGDWEGMKKSEVTKLYPNLQELYFKKPSEFLPVGNGESFHDVWSRVVHLLNSIIDTNTGRNILIVTHTAIVKIIMSFFEDRPLERLWDPPRVRTASLSHVAIEPDRGNRIIKYADTSHFRVNRTF